MAAEIKLTKSDESPWGFRLTGGRDFGTPLTIIKVTAHLVAEEAGLQVGDILVKINDIDCHSLTHKEAQDIIMLSNNAVTFAVLRGSLSLPDAVIDRLTPLPFFKTPEPSAVNTIQQPCQSEKLPVLEPTIEVIPIRDLEPEILAELGLNPLPEDFLEMAKRDPSPMPEVRPQSRMSSPKNVLEALEDLGLQDIVQDIERQKEDIFRPPSAVPVVAENAPIDQQEEEMTEECCAESLPESAPVPILTSLPAAQDAAATDETAAVVPISDEEFAEFISGQEEVIEVEGKNALGVDFKKFEPQAEFIRKSQVFRTLQESEKVVTKEEKDKRWTTFLEKPKGPKPKPKPKPQSKQVTEIPREATPEPVSEEKKGLYDIPSEEEFAALVRVETPTVTNEPQVVNEDQVDDIEQAQTQIEVESLEQQLREEQESLQQQLELEKQENPEVEGVKSEIELQLEEIQRQLVAIQQLPFEIQQHLALVQQQLNQIVQHRLNQQENDASLDCELMTPSCPRPSMVSPSQIAEHLDQIEEKLASVEESANEADTTTQDANPEHEDTVQEPSAEETKPEFKLRKEEEPPILPPPKKERPRKKRPFLGLGPAPRPLILPGGRKWRSPKDAYNDEFIAETLSAQAEIITGTTLGVNFRRYEPKQPSLVHLRDSTVYKMIHDLEDPNVVNKGLACRPEIVPAIQDYLQQSAPAAS